MTAKQIEQRLSKLEAEVEQLKAANGAAVKRKPWWEAGFGAFADAPKAFDEAMRIGREYRESLRPKAKRKGQPKAGKGARRAPRHRSR